MESKRELIINDKLDRIGNLKFFSNGKYAIKKNMIGLYFTTIILIINCIFLSILMYV